MQAFEHHRGTEPGLLLELEERSSMALLRLIAAAGLAVTVLGLALRLTA
jgi:hypothetical protein